MTFAPERVDVDRWLGRFRNDASRARARRDLVRFTVWCDTNGVTTPARADVDRWPAHDRARAHVRAYLNHAGVWPKRDPAIVVNVRLPGAVVHRLRELANGRGVPLTVIIRDALTRYVDVAGDTNRREENTRR